MTQTTRKEKELADALLHARAALIYIVEDSLDEGARMLAVAFLVDIDACLAREEVTT